MCFCAFMLWCVNICACVRILNETQPLVPMASGRARDCACLTPLTEHRSTKPITQPTDVPQHRKDCATTNKEQYPPSTSAHTPMHTQTHKQNKQDPADSTEPSSEDYMWLRTWSKTSVHAETLGFARAAFHMSVIEGFVFFSPSTLVQ